MKTIRLSEIQRNKNKTFSVKLSHLFSDVANIFPKMNKLFFRPLISESGLYFLLLDDKLVQLKTGRYEDIAGNCPLRV
jgi:hypothetical protein